MTTGQSDHKLLWDNFFEGLVETWKKRLELNHWEIGCVLTNDAIQDNPKILGFCEVERRHGHRAEITFVERLANVSEQRREFYVVHELVHIILDELCAYVEMHLDEEYHEYLERLIETAVSDLAGALINTASLAGKDE